MPILLKYSVLCNNGLFSGPLKSQEEWNCGKIFLYPKREGINLNKPATSCNFGTAEDSPIWDWIFCGIQDTRAWEKMLGEVDLTLETTLDICRVVELSKNRNCTGIWSRACLYSAKETNGEFRWKNDKNTLQQCKYCGGKHGRLKPKCPGEKCHSYEKLT